MLTRAQAWSWYFDRNPRVAAVWGHQNGRWPMHLGGRPADALRYDPEEYECIAEDCWCRLEIAEGGDEDAREGHAPEHDHRDPR
jgi:hypothetical protein